MFIACGGAKVRNLASNLHLKLTRNLNNDEGYDWSNVLPKFGEVLAATGS